MKKFFVLLLSSALFLASVSKSVAQGSNNPDILTGSQFVSLIYANSDRAEEILPRSFVTGTSTTIGRQTFRHYKREYFGRSEGDGVGTSPSRYDEFSIGDTGDLFFYTTDPHTYREYKEQLISYGFKWDQDNKGIAIYYYIKNGDKIMLTVATTKSSIDQSTVYTMTASYYNR